jgi:hypothetical protein
MFEIDGVRIVFVVRSLKSIFQCAILVMSFLVEDIFRYLLWKRVANANVFPEFDQDRCYEITQSLADITCPEDTRRVAPYSEGL